MSDGTLRAPAFAFEATLDRDARWRHAIALLAALLLHLVAILILLDEFPHGASPSPDPIPVELAFEPPKPPEPLKTEPPPPQQPVPDRRSGGDREDLPNGPLPPKPEEQPAQQAETPIPAPPPPTPALPDTQSPEATPVPPPLAAPPTQQSMAAPPTPSTKPRNSAVTNPAKTELPADQEAEPDAPFTLLEPGQGGGDRYLNKLRDDLLAHMFYPPTAEMFGLGGIVTYAIVIDRRGELLDATLERSSGLALIDKAGLQTIRLAAPFDPVPDEIPGQRIRIFVDLTIGPRR